MLTFQGSTQEWSDTNRNVVEDSETDKRETRTTTWLNSVTCSLFLKWKNAPLAFQCFSFHLCFVEENNLKQKKNCKILYYNLKSALRNSFIKENHFLVPRGIPSRLSIITVEVLGQRSNEWMLHVETYHDSGDGTKPNEKSVSQDKCHTHHNHHFISKKSCLRFLWVRLISITPLQ